MSNYKRKDVFDYLTRKPVTTQDIEKAFNSEGFVIDKNCCLVPQS